MQIVIGTPVKPAQAAPSSGYTGRLSPGDEVKGEVLSSDGKSAVIKTEGGAVFKAALSEGASLMAGDKITLSVQEKTGAQVVMKLVVSGGGEEQLQSPDAALEAQLLKLGIPEGRMDMAKALSSLKLPVTLAGVEGASALVEAFPALSNEQAAFLAANSIAPDEALLDALKAWTEQGDTVGSALARLSDALIALEKNGAPPKSEVPSALEQEVGGAQEIEAAGTGVAQGGAAVQHGEGQSARQAVNVQYAEAGLAAAGMETELAGALERLGVSGEARELLGRLPSMNPEEARAEAARFAAELPEGPTQGQRVEIENAILKAAGHGNELKADYEGMALEQNAGESAQAQPGVPLSPQAGRDAGELLDAVKRLFAKLSERPEESAREVERAAKELMRGIDGLKERLDGSALRDVTALVSQADSAQSQARLMDSINRFAYIQIPVELKGERRDAELYVMKRRGARAVDPEHVTMLVALETQSMGRIESVVKVEGRSVAIRFRAGEEGVRDFLKAHSVQLHNAVSKAGYRLADVKCSPIEEAATPINIERVMEEITVANSQLLDIVI